MKFIIIIQDLTIYINYADADLNIFPILHDIQAVPGKNFIPDIVPDSNLSSHI